MIDEKKLAEMRKDWVENSPTRTMILAPELLDVDEVLDTLEALWRVARAADERFDQWTPETYLKLKNALDVLKEKT